MRAASHLSVVHDGERPPPLLPPELDLGDMPEVMLNIQWLCDSRWAIMATPEEQIAAVRLHARSQHEKPAAALPDNDEELAFLAGYGRDVPSWQKVRVRALEGWTLCSDGRLYRRDMAVKALNTWIKLLADRRKQASGVAKRKKIAFNSEPYDRPLSTAVDALYSLDPHARILRNYLNVSPDLDGEDAPQGRVPDNNPDNVPLNYKGKEPKGTESGRYISPAAPAAGVESPGGDSAGGCGKPAKAQPAIPVLPWPLHAFDPWWAIWPHKVERLDAVAAFTEMIDDPPIEFPALLEATRLYAERKPSANAWCHPATWLRKKRWEDQWPDPPPPPPRSDRYRSGSGRPFTPMRLNAQ